MPNGVIILVRHCVVRIFPIHPLAQPDRLLGLNFGIFFHSLFAPFYELGYAVKFNVFLGLKVEFFFNLYFHPKSLTIKAVLKSLVKTPHRLISLEQIFIRSAPSMMNPHWVIGGYGTVQKRPALFVLDFTAEFLKNFILFPET